jgi:hypothetical protein
MYIQPIKTIKKVQPIKKAQGILQNRVQYYRLYKSKANVASYKGVKFPRGSTQLWKEAHDMLMRKEKNNTFIKFIQKAQQELNKDNVLLDDDVNKFNKKIKSIEMKKFIKKAQEELNEDNESFKQDINEINKKINNNNKNNNKKINQVSVILFSDVKPNYNKKIHTLNINGVKHYQVAIGNVNVMTTLGDITPYNGKYTKVNKQNIQLINILSEHDPTGLLGKFRDHKDIDQYVKYIYVYNPVSIKDNIKRDNKTSANPVKKANPKAIKKFMKNINIRIFNNGNQADKINTPFIKYDINKEALKFSDLFKIDFNNYTNENYHTNSCFLNAIIDTYVSQFQKVNKNGTKDYKNLTYESLCGIIGIEHRKQNIGLTITQSINFFEKFKLGLCIYSVFGKRVFQYIPIRYNKKMLEFELLRVVLLRV